MFTRSSRTRIGSPPAAVVIVAAFTLFLIVACRNDDPVAVIRVEPSEIVLHADSCTPISIQWTVKRSLDDVRGQPIVFVHLLDRPNSVVRTFDHTFPEEWSPGVSHTYSIDLCLADPAGPPPPGDYLLTLGLYDGDLGYRWTLVTGADETSPREYHVASVRTRGRQGATPFLYRGEWDPVELTEDRQIVARRRAHGVARILIRKAESPLVRMAVTAAVDAYATIVSSCAPDQTFSIGPGSNTLTLAACDDAEIVIDASPDLWLDGIAWTQGESP